MGVGCSSSLALPLPPTANIPLSSITFAHTSAHSNPSSNYLPRVRLQKPTIFPFSKRLFTLDSAPKTLTLKCGRTTQMETEGGSDSKPMLDLHGLDDNLVQKMVYDALVWSSLHGLVVGDRNVQRSGTVPGVGMVHAPFALLPTAFPENQWKVACEVAPIFNELVDRVSLDGKFLKESLSRTKKVDAFTSRLLDIHSKMLEINKKEEIRLGLHRSDYMLDEQTKLLLQIELNTISTSFPGLSSMVSELHRSGKHILFVPLLQIELNTISTSFPGLSSMVSELHRSLLRNYGEHLGYDFNRTPCNDAANRFSEALAKAWSEYNNPKAVIMVVVQPEEHNMYDQHWLSFTLKERHNVTMIRKTMAEIDKEGEIQPDGTLLVGGHAIAVIYFRAGYAPTDYPSEAEWRARLLMEHSSAIKCPSISYHLTGTKKIQQELAKPNVLEKFLDNKKDITKLRKCFAGLWSLDDADIVDTAIEKPHLFVMKPQREGGGNNIFGDDVREALLRLRNDGKEEHNAVYILMQRIFPTDSSTFLVRDGICHKDHAISELGIYGTYLRNKDKVIVNEKSGYLMRTKVSSSNEGGVAAGFAVLDSIYLT